MGAKPRFASQSFLFLLFWKKNHSYFLPHTIACYGDPSSHHVHDHDDDDHCHTHYMYLLSCFHFIIIKIGEELERESVASLGFFSLGYAVSSTGNPLYLALFLPLSLYVCISLMLFSIFFLYMSAVIRSVFCSWRFRIWCSGSEIYFVVWFGGNVCTDSCLWILRRFLIIGYNWDIIQLEFGLASWSSSHSFFICFVKTMRLGSFRFYLGSRVFRIH